MRALTEIEVQYVSGGNGKAPPPPAAPPSNDGSGNNWGDWLQDMSKEAAAGIARIRDAIAGVAEDIGAGIRDVLSDGPSHTKLGPYESTTCAPGQDMPKPGTCVTPAPKEEKKGK